ncbi:hypothetical protein BKA64DRAFT_747488 [Cadophora sp. MPI-SDFR-AT-0126]|nr:hypothetical protein BKA64DRAFT_747488 [Leotiomycetes sp. MPI-SDFR-AT-0126]
MWYKPYPNIGGIFFDEGWPECGPNNQYVNLYKYINDFVKRAYPGAVTVLNPGSPIASCFEDTMDTLLTFELNYDSYINSHVGNDWVARTHERFGISSTKCQNRRLATLLSLQRNGGAGFIQITDDIMPNPYDNLPSDSYMQIQLNAVAGGSPLNSPPSSWPSGSTPAGSVNTLTLTASDYSSAGLSWTTASSALGYHVYLGDSELYASVPGSMTSMTIGGLSPGNSYEFYVLPVGQGGNTGFSSNRVTVNTNALPGGVSIINYSASPSGGSTTFKADILVPYAFVHLYIWDSIDCELDTDPGWSINFSGDGYVCTTYMVEESTLYKYTGTIPAGSINAPWAWTSMGDITRTISGYTYTWTLPLGTVTVDTSKYVVQVQGYNPYTTVFEPDPKEYDCKGSTLCTTPGFLAWCDHAVNHLGRNDKLVIKLGTAMAMEREVAVSLFKVRTAQ